MDWKSPGTEEGPSLLLAGQQEEWRLKWRDMQGGWVGTNKLGRKQSPKPGQLVSGTRRGWEEGGNLDMRCSSRTGSRGTAELVSLLPGLRVGFETVVDH